MNERIKIIQRFTTTRGRHNAALV